MQAWQNPPDPDTEQPPETDEQDNPFERPPFDRDPEAQRAPGAGHEDPDSQQPPMQATSADGESVIYVDGAGIASEPVGNDNIRDGTVGGVMGPAHQQAGQGQGG